MNDRKILLIGGVVAIAVIAIGGIYLSTRPSTGNQFAACQAGVVSGGMDSFGTDFTLTRDDGNRVTAAEVFDKPSLLYFGYTMCPDVCPLDSARNAEAEALLKDEGRDVQTVMITIDPRRDTPEVMAEFTDLFSENMIGLTGTNEEIDAVSKGWRNIYKAHDEEDKEYYLVDHMTMTYLVLPGNKTVEFFPRDVTPEVLAERVGCFLDAAG
ncbi:SCO family protein [Paracoccus caeni]|uniref:SCO family protein n=1 Tax=Paracoccus caeni TaxID=657651 RepID=A0A934W144_9RHOB|nr:SCO family protein [Paracoccus caeni]MBK4217605.1 SCO family protein [Paracoccus caeni]